MVALAAGLALIATACSSSSSSTKATTPAGGSSSTAAGGGATVASRLVLGGAPECPQRPFCIPGLERVYGIKFKDFKALDADGPLTYQAISSGAVDVAEVFSSDAQIADKGLVVLNDDKHLENADDVVPVIRTSKATPAVSAVVNKVSAALTTDILISLNKQVGIDKADPSDAASGFLKAHSLDATSTTLKGVSLSVASFNFPESAILAYAYGKALQAAGATISFKINLGSRETVEPGLQSGQIDLVPEYAATALEFINKGAGEASGDINATVAKLKSRFSPLGVTVLDPTTALDTNAFAVTKATADKYHLVNLSDLAKPVS